MHYTEENIYQVLINFIVYEFKIKGVGWGKGNASLNKV